MTTIESARAATVGAPRPRATGAAAAGASFRVPEAPGTTTEASEAGAAEAAGPLADAAPVTLGVLLAAEALDRDSARDRAARRQGLMVLGGLTALQRALLTGDAAGALERLAALVDDMPPAAEPRLAALLATVVLRARVELARLDGGPG